MTQYIQRADSPPRATSFTSDRYFERGVSQVLAESLNLYDTKYRVLEISTVSVGGGNQIIQYNLRVCLDESIAHTSVATAVLCQHCTQFCSYSCTVPTLHTVL